MLADKPYIDRIVTHYIMRKGDKNGYFGILHRTVYNCSDQSAWHAIAEEIKQESARGSALFPDGEYRAIRVSSTAGGSVTCSCGDFGIVRSESGVRFVKL